MKIFDKYFNSMLVCSLGCASIGAFFDYQKGAIIGSIIGSIVGFFIIFLKEK